MYVGVLRSFKLGYFRGLNINTISALGMHLYESGDGLKLQRKGITLPRQPDSGRATPFHPDGVALSIKGCSYPEQKV